MKRLILWGLAFYKNYISVVLPKSCRFWPSCSCYARESIKRYGALKGGLRALWRIVRCQPFSAGGYDPVK
ncbi:MAG: membrane protein insertion efficiency factor YidD [Candidatus Omnitrophota bacterium]|nr:membrane protein insertion efficiency factor YidD [Candidatus Omnitrophota bacterium]